MPSQQERQEGTGPRPTPSCTAPLAPGQLAQARRGLLETAQTQPGPSGCLGAPCSKGLKGRGGTGSLEMDNGGSVVPWASAFLRHECRRPGEGPEGTPPPSRKPLQHRGAGKHTHTHTHTHTQPPPSHHQHQPRPFLAQDPRGYRTICVHTLSQAHAHTHNCTRVMRWLMPTHANRNMGKPHTHTHTHTHTQSCPVQTSRPAAWL